MNDDYLTLDIFKTVLRHSGDVDVAIEQAKTVLAELFPKGAEDDATLF